jgi:tetratricopeptide (TPR) repeat protein
LKAKKNGFYIFIVVLALLVSCGDDSAFTSAFNQAMQEKSGRELFDVLIGIDQQYPDRLALKVNLGALMLQTGELEAARVYLQRAEQLVGGNGDKKLKAMLYENLAQLALMDKNFDEVLSYADKALAEGDAGGISFLKGKVLYFQGKKDEALEAMDSGWPKIGDNVAQDELELYLDLLIDKGRNDDALGVLDEYLKRYGYKTGISNTGSVVAQRAGKQGESILYAFMDLEYGRECGRIDAAKTEQLLFELKKVTGLGDKEQSLIDGLLLYTKREWNTALDELEKNEWKHHLYQFVKTICEIESGTVSKSEVESFLKLEGYYRSFPAYYYYVWRGMKAEGIDYTIVEVRTILEKEILIAKGTEYEKPTRRELGRLIGLSETDADKILIGPELDEIYGGVLKSGNIKELAKVLPMFELPENVYSMAAEFGLKDMVKRNDAVKAYVEELVKSAGGAVKERLARVLGK